MQGATASMLQLSFIIIFGISVNSDRLLQLHIHERTIYLFSPHSATMVPIFNISEDFSEFKIQKLFKTLSHTSPHKVRVTIPVT